MSNKNIIHGESKTRLHNTWTKMIDRCYRPKENNYERYGGRGIKVCEEWLLKRGLGYIRFKEHLLSLYPNLMELVALGYELDRIKNDRDYSPGNVRMVTRQVNGQNKRNNFKLTMEDGTIKTAGELWESVKDKAAVDYRLFVGRLRDNWGCEKAAFTNKRTVK